MYEPNRNQREYEEKQQAAQAAQRYQTPDCGIVDAGYDPRLRGAVQGTALGPPPMGTISQTQQQCIEQMIQLCGSLSNMGDVLRGSQPECDAKAGMVDSNLRSQGMELRRLIDRAFALAMRIGEVL